MNFPGQKQSQHPQRPIRDAALSYYTALSLAPLLILLIAQQQDKDIFRLLTDLLRSPQPKLLDILPEAAES